MRSAVDSGHPSAASGNASRPNRWSQWECVASRPETGKPDRSRTSGSARSSSGYTGESSTNPSSPARTAVQVVCQTSETNTITSVSSATTRIGSGCLLAAAGAGARSRSGDAEQLRRVAQARDLGVGLLLAGLELLLVAVDPDDRDLLLQARLDIVVIAGRHVDPALL